MITRQRELHSILKSPLAPPPIPPPPPSVPPNPPTNLTAEPGNTQVFLTWTASTGALSYKIKRSLTSGGPYDTIVSNVIDLFYLDTGLTNGTTYYYVVSAVNSAGESANSSQVSATPTGPPPPPPSPPPVPTNLAAVAGNTIVNLSWNGSVEALSYKVKRALVSGGPYTTIAPTVIPTNYLDTGLTNGTPYYYVVSAVNDAGESANSAEATATPSGGPILPTLRGVVNIGSNSAALNNVDVDAGVARVDWGSLETAPGVFSWTDLDAKVAAVVASGKKLCIGIATGGMPVSQGGNKPDWLYDLILANGGQLFSYKQQAATITIPVHWDTTYLNRKHSMITAVGAHLAAQPVVLIRLNYMNANSEDFNPGALDNNVDGLPPAGSTPQSRWLAAGWSESVLIAAGNTTFASYNTAFPNALLGIAIGAILNPVLAPSGEHHVNDTVINTARTNYPNRVFATKNSLTARAPIAPGQGEWLHLWNSRPCAIQMLWHAFNDPSHRMGDNDPLTNLFDSINRGLDYEPFWLEIYEVDCAEPSMATAIHHAHVELTT